MKRQDVDLLVRLTETKRNLVWASQGQNSYLTQKHIDHALFLAQEIIKTIQAR